MRDKLKNIEYFNRLILNINESIERKVKWIEIGKTQADRINFSMRSMVWDHICLIGAKYSIGYDKYNITNDLIEAVLKCCDSWDGFWKLKNSTGNELDQYVLSAYDEMLWMLSLGYLINIPDEMFSKLVEVIDRDHVKDYLFEFIIRAKLPKREPIQKESYSEYFGVPKVFEKLRQAISEHDKEKAQKLIKMFLEKDWYNNHKEAVWHNSHKGKNNTYFGYWSFETAAVVKIMSLDDDNFKENNYYPKDLV